MEKLVYGGDGLARLDGRVVLLPFVLPGEKVRAESEQEKPGLVRARAVEILEPSADRVAADCPYFERCGGCHYQHMQYAHQVDAKRSILREELRRLGKIEPPETIDVVMSEPWGYRNRAQLHIEGARLGYREARSHRLCAIERCPISSPKINETIAALNGMLRDSRWPNFIRSIEVFTDERQMQINVLETERPVARRFFDWCGETIAGFVDGPVDYDGRFRVSGNSFFQVNRFLLDELVATAVEGASGESAVDLYSGVGLFSLALAPKFREVIAVESGAAAVHDLQLNAEHAGAANLRAEQKQVEQYLGGLDRTPDLILADPPRSGLGKAVVRRLIELKPPQLTIVACDPATLARDLSALLGAGYRVERMTLVDLFPQTYHVETVVRLRA